MYANRPGFTLNADRAGGCKFSSGLCSLGSAQNGGGGFCAILFDNMLVRELMKTHVVKTTPDAPLAEAVDLMDIYQVNSLPVVDSEGRLVGIVSEEDIWRAVHGPFPCPGHTGSSDTARGSSPAVSAAAAAPVSGIMQRAVISVAEDADARDAIRTFFVNDYTRLPVTSADGSVAGTLNRIDILQAIFERTISGLAE